MGYLIGFLTVGCIVVGLIAAELGNGALIVLSTLMFIVCLTLCILDAFMAISRGVKRDQAANWVVPSHFARKLK